jgi:hypothetical protein
MEHDFASTGNDPFFGDRFGSVHLSSRSYEAW